MRTPRIRFLDVEDPSKPFRRVDADPAKRYYRRTLKVPKVLVREPRLMVPGKQPLGPVKLLASEGHFKFFFIASQFVDLVSKRGPTTSTSVTRAGTMSGLVASGTSLQFPLSSSITLAAPFAFLLGVRAATSTNLVVAEINGNSGFSVQTNTVEYKVNLGGVGAGSSVDFAAQTPTAICTDNSINFIAVAINNLSTGGKLLAANGISELKTATTDPPSIGTATVIDLLSRAGSFGFGGGIWLFAISQGRTFTTGDLADLTLNPYQMLIPA
jgi:hypothetical protein